MIWTALALVISLVTGWLLVKALWPAERLDAAGWLLQFSLAAGLGLGATSLVTFLVLLLRGRLGRASELIGDSILLALFFAIWSLKRKPAISPVSREREPRSPFLLCAAFLIALASNFVRFILLARKEPHGNWDGWSIWNLHARFLFRGGQFWKDTFSPLLDYYKPDYPLLVPGSIARLWAYANHESIIGQAIVAAIFTFALALLTTGAVARLRGSKQGMFAGLVILGTPAFVDLGATQCADLAIGFFFLATLSLLCLSDSLGHDNGYMALAGVAAGLATWTKNEGLMLLLVIVVARAALSARKLNLGVFARQHASFVAGLTPVLLPVLYFKARLVPPNDMVAGQGMHATLVRLASLSRYRITARAFVHQTMYFGGWFVPIVLVLVFYALLLGFTETEKLRRAVRAPVLAIAASLVGYFFVYIVTPHDVAWQLKWSVDRIFMQIWPAAVFSIFVVLSTRDEAINSGSIVSEAPAIDENTRIASGTTTEVATS